LLEDVLAVNTGTGKNAFVLFIAQKHACFLIEKINEI